MTKRFDLSIVLACYNRRDITLRCLATLFKQESDILRLRVYLFDDASSDGTKDAVIESFPQVTVVNGDGSSFWGGGMHAAMSEALKHSYDAIILLNDDVALSDEALQMMIDSYQQACSEHLTTLHVIVGAVTEPSSNVISYSGFKRRNRFSPVKLLKVLPNISRLEPCDTMNGNCVLVPREVASKIGPIDKRFIQQLGDLDYGYRASAIGSRLWVAPRPVGECASNIRTFKKPVGGPFVRWRKLNQPHGLPLSSWSKFMWRHGGILGLLELSKIYASALLRGRR